VNFHDPPLYRRDMKIGGIMAGMNNTIYEERRRWVSLKVAERPGFFTNMETTTASHTGKLERTSRFGVPGDSFLTGSCREAISTISRIPFRQSLNAMKEKIAISRRKE
jgi:hypothetical protein